MSCFLDVIVNSITGDCSNTSSGAFDISINGSAPDFTISWIDPSFGTIPLSEQLDIQSMAFQGVHMYLM